MPYKYKDGRVWAQKNKFDAYSLLLPYGMTNVTDPHGTLSAIREPSVSKRGESVVIDVVRAEPGLPDFQLETRLNRTLNYLFGLDCAINVQCHMGACDRPDNYLASQIGLHWDRAYAGDIGIDRTTIIEGDDAPDAVTVPMVAEIGPVLIDFGVEFLSARTISEDQLITGIAFLESECLEGCQTQKAAGEVGYLSTEADSGVAAVVHYTTDKGDSWAACSADPFGNDEHISSIAVLGISNNHRVLVARGSTDGSNPAEIAYSIVTVPGTTTWVTVDVGSVNGDYITKLLVLSYGRVYAVTNDGYIYISKNGGGTWTLLRSGSAGLRDIRGVNYGKNAGKLVAVGDAGTILLSKDYGENWTVITAPTGLYADSLTCCELTPDGTFYIGDSAGEMYGTFDDGDNWQAMSLSGITPTDINDIRAWGDSIIWVAANIAGPLGRVLRSTDGGASWELWSLNIPTNTGAECLAAVDPNVVWVGGAAAFVTKTTTQIIGW